MELLITGIEITISTLLFIIIFVIGRYIYKRLDKSNNRLLNPLEFFPEEEVHTLKQVSYLIMMLIFFILIIYMTLYQTKNLYIFSILDVIISLHLIIRLEETSFKKWILIILLLPIGAITFLIFDFSTTPLIDIIHIIGFVYFMKVYYNKFKEYTETNSLGITIVLLFLIIFISFVNTTIVESVNPLDSMVMVSNAFTSNGYAVLGHTEFGKLNSIFLVWGGYIISGVATATLTAAILTKHFNKKFDKLEKLIKENKK